MVGMDGKRVTKPGSAIVADRLAGWNAESSSYSAQPRLLECAA